MKYVIIMISALSFLACKSNKSKANSDREVLYHPDFTPGPPVIIYKTKADYSNNIPVQMSADGRRIVSYPSIADIKYDSVKRTPTLMNSGYLMDNIGIGTNTVYLDYTYETYSQLDSVPSIEQMQKRIKDKTPFTEMCNCGNKNSYMNLESQVNSIIAQDSLHQLCRVMIKQANK